MGVQKRNEKGARHRRAWSGVSCGPQCTHGGERCRAARAISRELGYEKQSYNRDPVCAQAGCTNPCKESTASRKFACQQRQGNQREGASEEGRQKTAGQRIGRS